MSEEEAVPPKRPRWRRRLVLLSFFVGGLAWVNGPGTRMLGDYALERAFEPLGLKGSWELQGSLLGGLRLRGLDLHSETGLVRELRAKTISPRYRLSELRAGKLQGLSVTGLHATIDLDAAPKKEPDPNKLFSLDLDALRERVNRSRELLDPIHLDLDELTLQLVHGNTPFVTLSSSHLQHDPGDPNYLLDVGQLDFGKERMIPAQSIPLTWTREQLAFGTIRITPELSIKSFRLDTLEQGNEDAELALLYKETQADLAFTAEAESLSLKTSGNPLHLDEIDDYLRFKMPLHGTVSSLDVQATNITRPFPQWKLRAHAETRNAGWAVWNSSVLNVDFERDGKNGKATFTGNILGSDATVVSTSDTLSVDHSNFLKDATLHAEAEIPQASTVLTYVRGLYLPKLHAVLPVSGGKLRGAVTFQNHRAMASHADLALRPKDNTSAPFLDLHAEWKRGGPLEGKANSEGIAVSASYDFFRKSYKGTADLDSPQTDRLAPWLAALGVNAPSHLSAAGQWDGSGELTTKRHSGTAKLVSLRWERGEEPPLTGRVNLSYQWPDSLVLKDTELVQDKVSLRAEAQLQDRTLHVPTFTLTESGQALATGKATIPLPATLTTREFLRQTVPVSLSLKADSLVLDRLQPWVPALAKIDRGAATSFDLQLSGSPANPVLEGSLTARNIRTAQQAKVPVVDLEAKFATKDSRLRVTGAIKSKEFPPALVEAEIPFRPGVWAESPELLRDEPLRAVTRIEKLDLARLKAFIPQAQTLQGTLAAHLTIGGTIGTPKPEGSLTLTGGAFSLNNSRVPPFAGVTLRTSFAGREAKVESFQADLAGGSLRASGTVKLDDAFQPQLDLAITGDHLPLWRDTMIIVRANSNLTVRGPWQTAKVEGSVRLVDSLVYKDIEILPIGVPFTLPQETALPKLDAKLPNAVNNTPEPFRNWPLAIRVVTEQPILIRGNIARGNITADIALNGTIGTPAPKGQAILNDVEALLPFSTLRVQRGFARFEPATGFDPILDIRGTSSMQPYDINLYFYGPLSKPTMVLTSDPPLPENEVLTLLATGSTSSELGSGSVASAKVAQLLVEELRRGRLPFGQRMREILRLLDRVEVRVGEEDPYTGNDITSASLDLTDRWAVSASVDQEGRTRFLAVFLIRFR